MTITRVISTLAIDTDFVDAGDVTAVDNQLLALINNMQNGIDASEQQRMTAISAPGAPSAGDIKLYISTADNKLHKLTSASADTVIEASTTYPRIPQGRLTLTSATPVTTSDVTAATTLYYTPYGGNNVTLYNGTTWDTYGLTEISLALTGLAASLPHDIFLYSNSGTLTLEAVVWTNTTTRATALATQNGVYVKTGTTSKRYVGTICTTSTIGQTEDSLLNRLVWNYYNRVNRDLYVIEATDSWTYATATIRPWNNSTTNRFSFVRGVSEDVVSAQFYCFNSVAGSTQATAGFGLDSTTVFSGFSSASNQVLPNTIPAAYSGKPSAGFHFLQLLERASGATVTFYGDAGGAIIQSGAFGSIAA